MRTKDKTVEEVKKIFSSRFDFILHFAKVCIGAGELKGRKFRFEDAHPDSFRRLFLPPVAKPSLYAASFVAYVFDFAFFCFARRHRAFQQVAENSIQAILRGCEAKSSWQVHQNCRG